MRAFDVVALRQLYRVFETRDRAARSRLVTSLNNTFISALNQFYDNVIAAIENATLPADILSDFQLSPRTLVNFAKSVLAEGTTRRSDFYLSSGNTVDGAEAGEYESRLVFDSFSMSQCFTYQSRTSTNGSQPHYSVRNRPSWWALVMDGHGMSLSNEERQRVSPLVDSLIGPPNEREGTEVHLNLPGSELRLLNPERYIFVPPGHVATLYVSMRCTERLGKPYGHCTSVYPFQPAPHGNYIQAACYDACIQRATMATCGCRSEELLYSANSNSPLPYCSSLGHIITSKNLSLDYLKMAFAGVKRRTTCAADVAQNRTVTSACDAMCPLACTEYHYDIDMNMIRFPSKNNFVDLTAEQMMHAIVERNDTERLALYKQHFHFTSNDTTSNDFSRFSYRRFTNDVSFVSVELKDLDLTVTSEMPDYTVYQLLSDIGGQLGLWIGMSVITLAEMLELAVSLIRMLMMNIGNKPMRTHDDMSMV
jgi:hypothetical protein